jgi:hypothetical protein
VFHSSQMKRGPRESMWRCVILRALIRSIEDGSSERELGESLRDPRRVCETSKRGVSNCRRLRGRLPVSGSDGARAYDSAAAAAAAKPSSACTAFKPARLTSIWLVIHQGTNRWGGKRGLFFLSTASQARAAASQESRFVKRRVRRALDA